jgi:hypothetical protein
MSTSSKLIHPKSSINEPLLLALRDHLMSWCPSSLIMIIQSYLHQHQHVYMVMYPHVWTLSDDFTPPPSHPSCTDSHTTASLTSSIVMPKLEWVIACTVPHDAQQLLRNNEQEKKAQEWRSRTPCPVHQHFATLDARCRRSNHTSDGNEEDTKYKAFLMTTRLHPPQLIHASPSPSNPTTSSSSLLSSFFSSLSLSKTKPITTTTTTSNGWNIKVAPFPTSLPSTQNDSRSMMDGAQIFLSSTHDCYYILGGRIPPLYVYPSSSLRRYTFVSQSWTSLSPIPTSFDQTSLQSVLVPSLDSGDIIYTFNSGCIFMYHTSTDRWYIRRMESFIMTFGTWTGVVFDVRHVCAYQPFHTSAATTTIKTDEKANKLCDYSLFMVTWACGNRQGPFKFMRYTPQGVDPHTIDPIVDKFTTIGFDDGK